MALLYYSSICSCVAISQAFEKYSHDKLTRMLNGSWSQQTLLDRALNLLFEISDGLLLLDDTVLEKPYAKNFPEASWVYSSKEGKVLYGIPVVLLVWSYKGYKIPIAFRVYKKGKSTKPQLALELLSYARNKLKLKPTFVLMDSWYSSKKILQRIDDYGWGFISQLKKNRKFNGVQLKKYRLLPYWNDIGFITGGLKVLVVKHRNKYYVTNRLSLDPKEVRKQYIARWGIEEIIRFLKSELNLESCQVGIERVLAEEEKRGEGAQEHHIALCILSCMVLQKEASKKNLTLYQMKRQLIMKGGRLLSLLLT
jgi:hypothetical protein